MKAIVWPREHSLLSEDFEDRLVDRLKGRVEAAYFFGSYGTPRFRPDSDVDLILIVQTERPFVERPRLFDDLYALYPRLDILVYTPGEFERLQAETVGFWASVKASLRPVKTF